MMLMLTELLAHPAAAPQATQAPLAAWEPLALGPDGAKASPQTVDKLAAALRTALSSPEVIEGLAQMGLEARPSTPVELGALLKKDTERWAPLIKTIGFAAES